MKPLLFTALLLSAALPASPAAPVAPAIRLSSADAARVGRRVWENECAGTVEGLVSWNKGEAFPSLGIGHFIWYPAHRRGPFEESFPQLVARMKERGLEVPRWLDGPAPWQTRAEMERDPRRPRELRAFLARPAVIAAQADFLVHRLEAALPKMLAAAPRSDRARVRAAFERVAATPAGSFALIDYVNFKGEGILETERYRGQGWGLLQVLLEMEPPSHAKRSKGSDPVAEFSRAAARVLARRVRNSPPERHEARWLAGWQARVERYVPGR